MDDEDLKMIKEIEIKNEILFENIKVLKIENKTIKKKIKKIKNYMKSNKEFSKRIFPNAEELKFECPVEECKKRYQKQNYLVTHIKLKHKNIYKLPNFQKGRKKGFKPYIIDYEQFRIKK